MVGLPKVDKIVVDAFIEMLMSEQEMLRPPEKAAAMMALICELHERQEPFPKRAEVAKHIDCSIATVDAALSTRLDEGYISQVVETAAGNVQRRHSVTRQTFYKPSTHLLNVYHKAKRGDYTPPPSGGGGGIKGRIRRRAA